MKEVRASSILKSGAVCLTADGPVSLEMEKYMRKVDGDRAARAQRVLELNPDSAPFAALQKAVEAGDKDTVSKYAKLLYGQALLLADLPLEDPGGVRAAGLLPDGVSRKAFPKFQVSICF